MSKKQTPKKKEKKQTHPTAGPRVDLTGPGCVLALGAIGVTLGYLAGLVVRYGPTIWRWFFA